jgi:large subunit ribosomal protein L24
MKPLVYKKKKRAKNAPVTRHKMAITKGDTVRVMTGSEKGKEGTVMRVDRKRRRVVVEGVRIVKRHRRAQSEGDEGGIIEMEAPIDVSNVMLLDPKSDEPTRIRRRRDKDGNVERISVKSGQSIPRKREK